MDFSKLSLYIEEELAYKKVRVISHREVHVEYIDVYFNIFDSTYVYSEFVDLEDYEKWLMKKRIENINEILRKS